LTVKKILALSGHSGLVIAVIFWDYNCQVMVNVREV
jgi:hypothetical protein